MSREQPVAILDPLRRLITRQSGSALPDAQLLENFVARRDESAFSALLRRYGGPVVVINPVKQVGLVNFRVPSDVWSLFLGTRIASLYVQPHIGGDIALLSGIAKAVIERRAMDAEFLNAHADGWEAFGRHMEALSWETIVHRSGVSKEQIDRVSSMYSKSRHAIFAWAMGVTHHEHGVKNVQAIANLAILRGMIGSPGRGLLPLPGEPTAAGVDEGEVEEELGS